MRIDNPNYLNWIEEEKYRCLEYSNWTGGHREYWQGRYDAFIEIVEIMNAAQVSESELTSY